MESVYCIGLDVHKSTIH